MNKSIVITLSGHAERFRLAEDAYEHLSRYLDRAGARLHDDPDRAEVVNDLERSVGDKLIALLATDDRVITAVEIDGVLDQIGTVETGSEPVAEAAAAPAKRRLRRIKEGQWFAGVCNGLAEYSEIDVDWVRTLFFFGTLLTGGLLAVVYIAMAFVLPVKATRDARS